MTNSLRLPLRRKLVSLRLHSVQPVPHTRGSSPSRWLFDLEQLAERRKSDRKVSLQCIEAIHQALTQTATQVEENLASIASLATELGLALAREIVGDAIDRELLDPTTTVLRSLESVTLSSKDTRLSIFLSPTDFSAVVSELQKSPEFATLSEHAEFAVDAELGQGSVRIETGAGKLLYEPREVLDILCEEVRRESKI